MAADGQLRRLGEPDGEGKEHSPVITLRPPPPLFGRLRFLALSRRLYEGC